MSAIVAAWNRTARNARLLPASGRDDPRSTPPLRSYSWHDNQIFLSGNISGFLPEDEFDVQPLWASDGSACLIADVRLDNRGELIRDLHLTQPERLADSSILLEEWLRWGPSCVDHIVGAFAFAVWAPGREELFAVRDHTGERPLHYTSSGDVFTLASMPQTLLAPESAGFDGERVATWLACVAPERDKSFFTSIRRLPPGHMLRVTRGGIECTQYWHPRNAKATRFQRDAEYAEALVDVLDRATEARLRSVTPVGCMLSAGLDSGSVCASAATLLSRHGDRLTAFTAVPRREFSGASEPWYVASEAVGASELARMYPNVDHVLVDSAGRDLLATMKQWTNALGEPALNVVNLLWFSAIFQAARSRGIGVLLEAACGNGTISWGTDATLAYLFRRGRWGRLLRTISAMRRNGAISARAAMRASLAGLLPQSLDRALVPAGAAECVYKPLMRGDIPQASAMRQRICANALDVGPDPIAEQTRLFEWFDFGNLRAAAQPLFGIDLRDPTADKRVYEFCFSIPPEQYVVGGHSRSLVRRAMKNRIPESTRLDYRRGLQGSDWYIVLREALPAIRAEVAEIERSPAAREWIDLDGLRGLLDDWSSEGYERTAVANQWHHAFVRAVSLGYFLRMHDPALKTVQAQAAAPQRV